MAFKLNLLKKAEALRKGEQTPGHKHSFLHWLFVILGTILMGIVFGLVGLLMISSGWIFLKMEVGWYKVVIGFPLALGGATLILINLYQIFAAVFDRYYSQAHCPFCHQRERLDGHYRAC